MSIKWSPLKVSDATDMIEECINQSVEPLEQARIVAREALNIPNIPQYVSQYLLRIIGEIDRTIGGGRWEPVGRLKTALLEVRESLPKVAIEEERKRLDSGRQLNLVT